MKRSGKLSEDRVGKLTSIGFVWDIGLNDWDEMLSELKHFKETHGHCNVSNESSEEPKLNEWLDEQRRKFQSGKLAPDRLLKLEQIGIVFQPPESPEDICLLYTSPSPRDR